MTKYEGMKTPCTHKGAHYPHLVGHYDTVRYGRLEKYCAGVNEERNDRGEVTKKGHFKVFSDSTGDPVTPSIFNLEFF